MNKETIFLQWKEHRRHLPVPENFSAGVMARIEIQTPRQEYELPAGLTDFPNRLVQWGAAAGLVLLGIFRILYIAANLLRTSALMPY